jgi:hypothetical protein
MVVNFSACEISRDAHKLARTPILIKKNKKNHFTQQKLISFFLTASQSYNESSKFAFSGKLVFSSVLFYNE